MLFSVVLMESMKETYGKCEKNKIKQHNKSPSYSFNPLHFILFFISLPVPPRFCQCPQIMHLTFSSSVSGELGMVNEKPCGS